MSRVAQVLSSISDPSLKAVIQEEAYKEIRQVLAASKPINPYALPPDTAEYLENQGILTNPFSIQAHTHAAAKCIENDLYASVSHYLPKASPVTFLFMKPAKLQYFRRGPQQKDVFKNTWYEPKDVARYPEETVLQDLGPVDTPLAFMGDTLHFLHPSFLTSLFSRSPHLQTFYATMVLPIEAKYRLKSLHPLVYSLQYLEKYYIYAPGGHSGASYCHEYRQLEWLTVGRITGPDGTILTAQRVESKGANHLFVFCRGSLHTPPIRSFATRQAYCTLPAIFLPRDFNARTPFPKTLLQQLFLYIKSVKQVTERDIYAKIRQLIKTQELQEHNPRELTLLCNYYLLISQLDSVTCFQNILGGSIIQRMLKPLLAWIAEVKQCVFGREEFVQLLQALEWRELTMTEEVVDTTTGSPWDRLAAQLHYSKPYPLPGDLEDCYPAELRAAITAHFSNKLFNLEELSHPLISTHAHASGAPDLQPAAPTDTVETDPTHIVLGKKHAAEILALPSPPPSSKTPTEAPAPSLPQPALPPPGLGQAANKDDFFVPADSLPWALWTPKLQALGFRADQRQTDPATGELIMPITEIRSGLPKVHPDVDPGLLSLLQDLSRAPTAWTPDTLRAKSYASDVKNHRTGALLHRESTQWKETLTKKAENLTREIALTVIHGAGGSGKSHALQEYLRANPGADVGVILPTNELRMDWMKKLPHNRAEQFRTYERALTSTSSGAVIFDDYTKLPAGFIEAFALTQARTKLCILTGDSRQSSHHESNEQAMINQLEPAALTFAPYCRYYINATHRNKRDLANRLGVYSEREGETTISMGFQPLKDVHLLVPSLLKKATYGELGHKVSTYAGCQGITAPRIQVLLDNDTTMCSKEVLYTALSRAVHSIHFINTGPNHSAFWEKLEVTPYLKTFLSTVREQALRDTTPAEAPEPQDPSPSTHFPVENPANVFSKLTEDLLEKHEREIHSAAHGHSNCVQTDDPVVQLFSHQQAKDETLLWATIEARLKVSSPDLNWQEFLAKKDIGDVLWAHYKRAMQLPEAPLEFNEDLWRSCGAEVQNTYLSKAKNMLLNGARRQSPDFGEHDIMLFLKSQWVKKMEKLGAPKIKPGQTIASFQQMAVMLYGTMARYMRRFREALGPDHIMINCEKTPADISRWAHNHWSFEKPSYANDFTAFDQSQDGSMLQFEILKAKYHSIPEEIIQGYLDIKLNAKVFLGTLSIMRLTGEGPTFDANTECNIAYTHARFDIPPGTAQLYAGDDSAIACVPPERPSFKLIAKGLSLTAKPQVALQTPGHWAEFCGYLLTPCGIIKDPAKLYASLELAKRTTRDKRALRECAENYERDLALAYMHKDALHEILSPEQAELHQLTVRSIVKLTNGTFLSSFD